MPLIHHPVLKRELDVSDQAAEILTTNPRTPWVLGPLPSTKHKPTATTHVPEEGTPEPSSKED